MKEAKISDEAVQSQVSEVTRKLKSYGISMEGWGTGKAKTVNHLTQEILEGETVLVDINGELVRRVENVFVDVRYRDGDRELQLFEDRQEFTDGRGRERGLTGVREKMKPGESSLAAAKRAMAEELDVHDDLEIEILGIVEETQPAHSYPGLVTEYRRHEVRTVLPDRAYKPEGYMEEQDDKKTFFVWKEIERPA